MEYRSISCIWLPNWPNTPLHNPPFLLSSTFCGCHRRKTHSSLNDCVAQSSPQALLTTVNFHMREKYTYCATILRFGIWDFFPAFAYPNTLLLHPHLQYICYSSAKWLLGRRMVDVSENLVTTEASAGRTCTGLSLS